MAEAVSREDLAMQSGELAGREGGLTGSFHAVGWGWLPGRLGIIFHVGKSST